jgi:hypothetical protein
VGARTRWFDEFFRRSAVSQHCSHQLVAADTHHGGDCALSIIKLHGITSVQDAERDCLGRGIALV